ncbi:MAG: hypothetical protein N2255_04215 [Kiritimatiellae bacterium]|nr:hypothetical protein [Kiritimatiellia bacterium]
MIGERFGRLRAREKFGAVLAGLFLLGVVVDRAVVRPVRKGFGRLDAEIVSEKAALDLATQVAEQEKILTAEFEKARSYLERAAERGAAVHRLKEQIARLEKETGVNILSIEDREIREPAQGRSYDVIAVEIGRFEARMQDLLKFLGRLQNEPGLLRVTNLNLNPVRGSVGQVRGSMLITKVTIR